MVSREKIHIFSYFIFLMSCADDNAAGTEMVVRARNRVPVDISPKATTINSMSDLYTHPTDPHTFSAPTETVGADMVPLLPGSFPKGNTDCEYTHTVTFGHQLSFTVMFGSNTGG